MSAHKIQHKGVCRESAVFILRHPCIFVHMGSGGALGGILYFLRETKLSDEFFECQMHNANKGNSKS